MEFLFITPYSNADIFNSYLAPSLKTIKPVGVDRTRCAQISDKEDSDAIKFISNKYNTGIAVVREQGLSNDELVLVFTKENVHLSDSLILHKLDYLFTEMPDMGVLGVMGSREICQDSYLYSEANKPVNGMIFKPAGDENPNGDIVRFTKNGFFENIIAVDDAIFAIKASMFDDEDFRFSEGLDSGFGLDISLKAVKAGYDVGVADILVISDSDNNTSFEDIDKIVKMNDITDYPVSVKNFNVSNNNVLEAEI